MLDKPLTRSNIVEAMKEAARIGGASLAGNFARLATLPILEKGPSDFVSSADIESERLIVAHLNEKLPEVAVLGEEGAASPDAGNGLRIIIDPLDGTNNFLHGIPQFSVSLALMEGEEVTAGGVSWSTNNLTVKEKVEPAPSTLSTQMRPPKSSTSFLLIDRPSPVPPKSRTVDTSPCSKAANSLALLVSLIPTPESSTVTRSTA